METWWYQPGGSRPNTPAHSNCSEDSPNPGTLRCVCVCSDVMMQGVGNKALVVFGVCPAGQLQHMDPTRYPTERSADPGGGGVWGWVIITSWHQCCSVPPHPLAWLAPSLCFPSPVLHLPTGQAARKHPHLPALITPPPAPNALDTRLLCHAFH